MKFFKVRLVNRFSKKFIVDIAIEATSKLEAKRLALKFYRGKAHVYAESATTNFKYLKVG